MWNFFRSAPEVKSVPSNLFFGQEGEDAVLAGLMDPNDRRKGFFVDVGAHHPTRFSNTWRFYQLGWRGVNVDPTPKSMEPFREIRPEDINLEIGISRQAAVRKFYCYNEPALNGIENDRTEELKGTEYKLEAVIDVETLPLSEVLVRHGGAFCQPNFLTIDVEGLEMEVLSSHDWARFPFDFVLIEQRLPDLSALRESEVWHFMSELRYSAVACTGRTVVYRSAEIT